MIVPRAVVRMRLPKGSTRFCSGIDRYILPHTNPPETCPSLSRSISTPWTAGPGFAMADTRPGINSILVAQAGGHAGAALGVARIVEHPVVHDGGIAVVNVVTDARLAEIRSAVVENDVIGECIIAGINNLNPVCPAV